MYFGLGRLAVSSMTRRPVRSGVLSLGSAVLAFALFILGTMYLSVTGSVERGGERLGADAMVVPAGWRIPQGGPLLSGGPIAVYLDAGTVSSIKGYEGVESSSEQLFIVSAPLACCSLANTVIVGFQPETDFTVMPWLRDGRVLRELKSDEIVIGPDILSEPGGRIRFFDKVFRVAAKLEPTGMPMMDSAVFIPMDGAREMIAAAEGLPMKIGPGEVSSVLLRFGPHINHAARSLRMEYDIPGIQVVLASEVMAAAKEDLLSPLRGMAAMSALWWTASILMTGVLYGVVLEGRGKEFSLLRSVGASRKQLLVLLSIEITALSFSGALAGILLAWALVGRFMGELPVPGAPSLAAMAAGSAILCVASSLVSTAYPLFRHSFKAAEGDMTGGRGT